MSLPDHASDLVEQLEKALGEAEELEVEDEYSAYEAELVLETLEFAFAKQIEAVGETVLRDEQAFDALVRLGKLESKYARMIDEIISTARRGGYDNWHDPKVDWSKESDCYRQVVEALRNVEV